MTLDSLACALCDLYEFEAFPSRDGSAVADLCVRGAGVISQDGENEGEGEGETDEDLVPDDAGAVWVMYEELCMPRVLLRARAYGGQRGRRGVLKRECSP